MKLDHLKKCVAILNSSKILIYYTNSEQLFHADVLPKYKTNSIPNI